VKALSGPTTTEIAAAQSGWCELVDIYLREAITTPWGTVSIVRLTTLPGGLAFFRPDLWPEAVADRGDPATYNHWPLRRQVVRSSSRTQNDKFVLAGSNVTTEFAEIVEAIQFRGSPMIVRKVSTTIATPAGADAVVVFSGFVDSVKITDEQILLSCSNDLGSLSTVLPSENMHQNCRFQWGDDWCTAIRYRAENYKAGTCGAGCTTTRIKSADLTEDDCAPGYVGQAVTADSGTDKVGLASHGLGNGDRVKFSALAMPGGLTTGIWYFVRDAAANDFRLSLTEFGITMDITSNGTTVVMDSSAPYGTDLVDALAGGAVTASSERSEGTPQACGGQTNPALLFFGSVGLSMMVFDEFKAGDQVIFGGTTPPEPFVAGTRYWVVLVDIQVTSVVSYFLRLATSFNGTQIDATTVGTACTVKRASAAANLVRYSQEGFWSLGTPGDWGTLTAGFWQIPDAQVGLANAALKPHLTFDFGVAVVPKVWRLGGIPGVQREELLRMLVIFSSTAADFATAAHESCFEVPPIGGDFFDLLLPLASSARYWRICVRSRWAETLGRVMFHKVRAYTNARNWWASGWIVFRDDTTTSALRGTVRQIQESYDGELRCDALPVAPASGDTFIVERDCPATWNACCERRNWQNFGGFLDLPIQSVIR